MRQTAIQKQLKFYQKKPEKLLILTGGVVLAYVVLKKILIDITNVKDQTKTPNTTPGQIANEIDTNKLSYQLSQYNVWADGLELAMFSWGTDEKAIYNIFEQLKTTADLKQLIKSFGIRPYTGGTLPYWFYGKLNLIQWLNNELDNKEKQTITEILSKKGITYKLF